MELKNKRIVADLRDVLRHQASSVMAILPHIDNAYANAVLLLARCQGKLILTGVGKSGMVAQKLASTFSSTGTPALYLHPTEAVHGNLGVVQKNDVVLAIGKSGESEELLVLMPSLKKMKVKIISLTSNNKSKLARCSDVVLHMPIEREACPLNLAPTTSTTVAQVIGDALAISLMKLRGFKKEQFALYHPGGRLGKSLILSVSDVMRSGKNNPVVKWDATIRETLKEISDKWCGATSVVNRHGKFIGLITDYDVRQMMLKTNNILNLATGDLLNPKPITFRPELMAIDAAMLMENRDKPLSVVPVVDSKSIPVGMLHVHDLISHGLSSTL